MSKLCFACKSNFSDYPCDLCLSKVCKGCSFFCEVTGIHEGKLLCRSCNAFLNFQKNFYTYRHVEIQKIKLEVQDQNNKERESSKNPKSPSTGESIGLHQRSETHDSKGDYGIAKITSSREKNQATIEQVPEIPKPSSPKSPKTTPESSSIPATSTSSILSTTTTTTTSTTILPNISSTSTKETSSSSWTSIPLRFESTICPGSAIWRE